MKKWIFLLLGAMMLAVVCQSAHCAEDPAKKYWDRLIGKKYVSQMYQLPDGETQAIANMADSPYIEFIDSDTCILFGGRLRDAADDPDFVPSTKEMRYIVKQEFGAFILCLNDDYSLEWQIGQVQGAPLFPRFGDQIPGFNGIMIEEKFAVSPDEIMPDGRIGRIWGYTPSIVYPAGDEYLAFRTPDTGRWGYAKTSGEVVLSPDYEGVTPDKKQISPTDDFVPMPATTRTVVVNELKEDPINHHFEYQMYSLLDGTHLLDMSQYDNISAFSADGILAARRRSDGAATGLGDMVEMDIIDDKGSVLKTIDQYYPYTEKGQNIISDGVFPVRRHHEWGTEKGCDELVLMTTDGVVVQPSLQNPEVGLTRIVDNYFRFRDESEGIGRPRKGDAGPGQYEFEVCEMAPFADSRDKTPVSVDFYWNGGEWEGLDIDNSQTQCIGVMDRQGVVALFESPIDSISTLDKDISDKCFDDAFLSGSMIFDYEGHCLIDADDLDSFQDENVNGIWYLGDGRVGVRTQTGGNSYDYWLLDLKGEVLAGPVLMNSDERTFDIAQFREGFCPAYDKAKGQWGYIDTFGKWAIPAAYDSAWSFEDGRAVVNGSMIIDRSGSIIWDWKALAGSAPEGGFPLTPPIDTADTLAPSSAGGLAGRRFECDLMADGQPVGEGMPRPFIEFTDGSTCTATTSLSQLRAGGWDDYQLDYLVQEDRVYVTDGGFPMISFIIGDGALTREPLTVVAMELGEYGTEYKEVSGSAPPVPHLSVSSGTVNGLTADVAGGQGMMIGVTSNLDWSVSVAEGANWISLSTGGSSGDGSFYTLIARNDGPERTGWIEVSAPGCETIRIKVAQSAAPAATTAPEPQGNATIVSPQGAQRIALNAEVIFSVECASAKKFKLYLKGKDTGKLYDAAAGGAAEIPLSFMAYDTFLTQFAPMYGDGTEGPLSNAVEVLVVPTDIQRPGKPSAALTNTSDSLWQGEKAHFTIQTEPDAWVSLYVGGNKVPKDGLFADGSGHALYDRAFSTVEDGLMIQFSATLVDLESELSDPILLDVKAPLKTEDITIVRSVDGGGTNTTTVKDCVLDADGHIYAPLGEVVAAIDKVYQKKSKTEVLVTLSDQQGRTLSAKLDPSNLSQKTGGNLTLKLDDGTEAGYAWVNRSQLDNQLSVAADQLLALAGYQQVQPYVYANAGRAYCLVCADGTTKRLTDLMPVVVQGGAPYVELKAFMESIGGEYANAGMKSSAVTAYTYGSNADGAMFVRAFINESLVPRDQVDPEKKIRFFRYNEDVLDDYGYVSVYFDSKTGKVMANAEELSAIYGHGLYMEAGQSKMDSIVADIRFLNSFNTNEMPTVVMIHDVAFSTGFFVNAGDGKYNHDVAKFALALTCASNTPESSNMSESQRSSYIRTAYAKFGFVDIRLWNFDKKKASEADTVAFSIASRKLANGKTLIAVICRGSGYGGEWVSNTNVGVIGDHAAFKSAAKQVLSEVERYMGNFGYNAANSVVLFSGFSRSAAVSNYAAHLMNQTDFSANGANVLAYTFASPTNTTAAASAKDINVFNIINPHDLVPMIPFESWGFQRFGEDIRLPGYEDARYSVKLVKYDTSLKQIIGMDSHDIYSDSESVMTHMYIQYYGSRALCNALDDAIASDPARYLTVPLPLSERAMFVMGWEGRINKIIRKAILQNADRVEIFIRAIDEMKDKTGSLFGSYALTLVKGIDVYDAAKSYLDGIKSYVAGGHRQETYVAWMYSLSAEDMPQ